MQGIDRIGAQVNFAEAIDKALGAHQYPRFFYAVQVYHNVVH